MKQIIPFVNDISFDSKLSEITSIALEHNLQMENSDSIVGIFTVNGKYKINEISVNEEIFEKEIPFDITLDDKYDASKVKIDIDDFYYEIINEELLRVHIDVIIDNLVYFKEEKKEEERCIEDEDINDIIPLDKNMNKKESDNMSFNTTLEEKEDKIIEDLKEDIKEESKDDIRDDIKEDIKDELKEISSSILIDQEEYVTYKVHIIRNDETIDTLIEKYNITKEELLKYNNLDNITIGSKIIVPIINE